MPFWVLGIWLCSNIINKQDFIWFVADLSFPGSGCHKPTTEYEHWFYICDNLYVLTPSITGWVCFDQYAFIYTARRGTILVADSVKATRLFCKIYTERNNIGCWLLVMLLSSTVFNSIFRQSFRSFITLIRVWYHLSVLLYEKIRIILSNNYHERKTRHTRWICSFHTWTKTIRNKGICFCKAYEGIEYQEIIQYYGVNTEMQDKIPLMKITIGTNNYLVYAPLEWKKM